MSSNIEKTEQELRPMRAETKNEGGLELKTKLRLLQRKKNKITLFFPSSNPGGSPPTPNLGIGYIGTVLYQHGHTVQCIDGNLITPEVTTEQPHLAEVVLKESLEAIEKTEPDILAVGSRTINFPLAADLMAEFARRFPEKLIVLGGYQASFLSRFVLEFLPQVDILVRGEGEYTMLELVQTLENGGRIEHVNGLLFKEGKRLIQTQPRALIGDLDTLPFIDYSLFPGFAQRAPPSLRIISSRGCPYRCTFCACKAFWHRLRTRSVNSIVEELKRLRNAYGVHAFGFCDDIFFLRKSRLLEFCRKLRQEKLDISWSFNSRIDTLDPSLMEVLLDSHVSNIFFGLESLNIGTLRFIGEKNPEEYVRKAEQWIEYCARNNVPCKMSTIVGFPNETQADIENTLKLVLHGLAKGVTMYTGLLVCYPGTPLWGRYEQKQLRLLKINDRRLRRNSSGFFAEKYEHLPECVPNAWMVQNEHLTGREMEQLLLKRFWALA
jgi:radical SAM superfamily enzyme YgiQ (UPF0313 family)